MPSVDDRVVAMKFDNNAFENKVGSTISSLSKLKSSLNFEGQTKSLQDLSSTSSRFNLDGIGSALETISGKFNAMGAIGFTVLNNITNAAINAGKRVVSALSIDPVMDGFKEYETNMNAIQTVLANTRSKGTTLTDVNTALAQLNTYSDKTIYNFGQMAKNIGTFTAAGVDLNTSVASIKGISNLAAISGSNAEQASSAMYQLSQALASGSVKLMDWNSIVNAGMGGEVFQKALFETGKSLHTIKGANLDTTFEQWTKAGGSFREQLESGWLTSKVLTTTLQGFTGDLNEEQLISLGYTKAQAKEFLELGKSGLAAATEVKTVTQLLSTIKESIGSGWSESFRLMVGDFEEAKTLFTSLNTVISGFIQKSADSRNKLLGDFKALGGRDKLIDGLRAGMFALAAVMSKVGAAFRDVFPKQTAESLAQMAENFRAFMHSLIPSESTLIKIGNIFRGIFSVLSIGWTVIKQVAGAFAVLFRSFNAANGSTILDFFSKIGEKAYALQQTLVAGGGIAIFFEKYINPIAKFIGSLDFGGAIQTLIDGFNYLKQAIASLFGDGGDSISSGTTAMSEATDRLGNRFGWLITIGQKLGEFFGWVKVQMEKAAGVFKEFYNKITDNLKGGSGDFSKVFDVLNTGLFAALILFFRNFLKKGEGFIDKFKGLVENISGVFKSLSGTLEAMTLKLKAEALLKIAIALGVLTASVFVLSTIDSAALTKALAAMAAGFGELAASMQILDKMISTGKDAAKLGLIAGAIILLSGAILILALAVKLMASIDGSQLAASVAAVGALLAEVTTAINFMPNEGKLISAGIGITAMAVGIGILSLAVKLLSTIDPKALAAGVLAVGALVTEVTLATKAMDGDGAIRAGLGIIGLSIGIVILAGAMKILATISIEDIVKGLVAIGAALAEIVITMNLMPPNMVATGAGLVAVAIGIAILAGAIFAMGSIPLDKLIQGLAGVAAALIILVVTMNLMPPDLPLIGAGLILVAGGLLVMSRAITDLGNMDTTKLVQGLAAVAFTLGFLAIALNVMQGTLLGAVAMVVAAGALMILSEAIKVMSDIPFSAVMLSLLGFAIVIAAIAVGATLLSETTPFIAALGAALLVLGLGLAAIGLAAVLFGAGIYLIAAAIKLLVDVGVTGIQAFITILPELTVAVVKAVLQAVEQFLLGLPPIIAAFGEILGAILDVIEEYSPRINEVMLQLITDFCNTVINASPSIINAAVFLIMTFLDTINANISKITQTVAEIITKFLDELSNKIQPLIDAGTNFLVNFLNGIANNLQKVIDATTDVIVEFLKGIANNIDRITSAGGDILVSLIRGLSNNLVKVTNAAGDLIVAFLKGLSDNIKKVIDAGFQFILDFLNGLSDAIDKNAPKIREAAVKLVRSIINGIVGGLGDLGNLAIEGIKNLAGSMLDGVKSIFGINSPSKEMYNIAGGLAEGFVKGFKHDKTAVNSAETFAGDMVTRINDTLAHVASIMDNIDEFNPTISPVLDLTNIEKGAARMGSIMGKPKIAADVSFEQAASIAVATRQDQAAAAESDSSSNKPVTILKEVNYNQTINAPTRLSTADIYRDSKSLVSVSQKE